MILASVVSKLLSYTTIWYRGAKSWRKNSISSRVHTPRASTSTLAFSHNSISLSRQNFAPFSFLFLLSIVLFSYLLGLSSLPDLVESTELTVVARRRISRELRCSRELVRVVELLFPFQCNFIAKCPNRNISFELRTFSIADKITLGLNPSRFLQETYIGLFHSLLLLLIVSSTYASGVHFRVWCLLKKIVKAQWRTPRRQPHWRSLGQFQLSSLHSKVGVPSALLRDYFKVTICLLTCTCHSTGRN